MRIKNKAIVKKGKQVVAAVEELSDAYKNIFNWWYRTVFSGIEPDMLAESQLDMCLKKAKELKQDSDSRPGW
jgi:hypothetical protein